MPIIKTNKTENYCIIPNAILENHSLSFQSKGLLCFLLSKPNFWQINVEHLSKVSTNGKDGIYAMIKELIVAGYVTKTQSKNSRGKFQTFDYLVYDQPSPLREKPEADTIPLRKSPLRENPTVLSTDNTLVSTEGEKIKNSKIKFCKKVIEWATKNPDKYPKLMYFDFAKHWLELAQSEKSMRYEGEKFFEIGKRLATWFSFSDNNKLSAQWTAEKDTGTINSLLLKLL